MTAKSKPTVLEYDLTEKLGVPAKKVVECFSKTLGQKVKKGELIASKRKFLKKRKFFAPVEGILASLTEEGVLRIRIPVKKKIKTKLPFSVPQQTVEIKGIWGRGERVFGELFCLESEATVFDLKGEHQGQILALSGRLNRGLWHKAKSLGAVGIICGGLADGEFIKEIEKEVLVVEGKKKGIALSLVVLSRENQIPQDIWQFLKANQGRKIYLEGDSRKILIPK